MANIDDKQLSSLMDDIKYIRGAIQKNAGVIRQMELSRSLRIVSFMASAVIFLFSYLFHLLDVRYGDFSQAPGLVQTAILVGIGICFLAVGLVKNLRVLRSARDVQPGISFSALLKEFNSRNMWTAYLITNLATVVGIIKAVQADLLWIITPIAGVAYGILMAIAMSSYKLKEFSIAAWWTSGVAMVLMFIGPVSIPLQVSATFGFGFLVLGVGSFLPTGEGRLQGGR